MKSELTKSLFSPEKIKSFVSLRVEEGMHLAFKTPDDIFPVTELKLNKLVCDVAAFANTIGGTIIFGIEKKRGRANGFIYNNELYPVSLLQYIIETRIQKKIKNFSIELIQTGNDTFQSVLAINIPESKDAPHMAFDNIYYKRHNCKSVPMEEYEIRIAYGKLSKTSLEFVGVFNTNGIPVLSNGKFISMMFLPRFMIRNTGNTIEKNYKFEIGIPSTLCDESYFALNTYFSRHDGIHNVYSIPCRTPLFQDELNTISEAKLLITKDNINDYLLENIFVNLFYTDGVKSTEFRISDLFKYNDKILKPEEFCM